MKKKMLSAALLLAALLCLSAAAAATDLDDNSTPITPSNVWKDSDIRKYLNNGVTNGQLNSTTEACNSTNDSGYAAHFTDAEYLLMQPTQVQTLEDVTDVTDPDSFVMTTDRIFLPSGRSENGGMKVLSWGEKDLAYMQELDKTVLIPLGYWANAVGDGRLWLRSAGEDTDEAMSYRRTKIVSPSGVSVSLGVAPVFTLDASTIHFASSESAAVWASRPLQYGSTVIEKSDYLGNKDNEAIPSPTYGMYLKTAYEGKDFRVKNLSCSVNGLSFEYAGGMPGDYVMIQAYEGDDFNSSVTGYAAAMRIGDGRGEMSVNMDGSSMADYTFKIWMENPSRVNLAQATEPQTFSFKNGSFVEAKTNQEIEGLPKNLRMFAMKHELNCSWGDLRDSNVSNVLAGGAVPNGVGNDSWIMGKSCGVNASNQIIYFGMESYSDPNGGVVSKPLCFWIAGRDVNEDNLTLYQVSTNEKQKHVFDKSPLTVETQMTISGLPESASRKPGFKFTPDLSVSTYELISTNPHVAEVGPNGEVTIRNYGEFSLILFSGGKAVQTDTISVVNSKPPQYIPASKWLDDETQEDEAQPEQPEQSEEAVQAAADGLPQTGDSSVLPLWAAALAAALAGLAARRRRSA